MERSKIIVELIKDEINVVQAMDILNLLLQDINDKKIKGWIDKEVNGYNENDEIPEYRIVNANVVGDYIVGNAYNRLQGTRQQLPLKPEYIKDYNSVKVTSGLNELFQLSIAEKENENHCLNIPIHTVIAQDITLINGQILNAKQVLSIYGYTNILNKLKSKLLKILVELERKYGNLDDYYIDFANDKKEKEAIQYITNIINDNSVHIGNDNKIENSNVGVGNEN